MLLRRAAPCISYRMGLRKAHAGDGTPPASWTARDTFPRSLRSVIRMLAWKRWRYDSNDSDRGRTTLLQLVWLLANGHAGGYRGNSDLRPYASSIPDVRNVVRPNVPTDVGAHCTRPSCV